MGALAAAKIGREQPIRVHRPEATLVSGFPLRPAIAANTAEATALWDEFFGSFFDRQAAVRLVHETNPRVHNRWRPKLALVLPPDFSVDRPSHRADLTAALEVLAATVEQYKIECISNSPDASRLFAEVRPYSAEAVAGCVGALVLGSRALNDEVAAIRPSRRVTADPCAFRTEGHRIVFEQGRLDWPFAPAEDSEVIGSCSQGLISAFVDENDDTPAFLDALMRFASGGSGLRVTLSSRSDEVFAESVRTALADVPQIEVEPAPAETTSEAKAGVGPAGFVLGNEPIALLTRRDPSRPAFLFHEGRFFRCDCEGLSRTSLYLYRGEEQLSSVLLGHWLRSLSDRPRTGSGATVPNEMTEPLVSIVVPVYDRTTELIRLASSIFNQSYPWIEVVFVSNGSPPETLEALRLAEGHLMKHRFRVKTIEIPRPCGSATIPRDVGIRSASGDLICVLDSDDWLEPDFFHFLTSQGTAWRDDTIYYPKKVFQDFGRTMREGFPWNTPLAGPGTVESENLPGTLRKLGNFFCNSGVCFSKSLFQRAGGIDHRLHYGEDLYLWWRMALVGARAEGHDGLVNIALHPGNNELAVGEDGRLEEAVELACDRGQSQWL
ncbi:glycosyltransferase family 2 protein [Tautonia marina]|uniref:glycosyltransferase family 2 protein n=1 Tax=Tautonia marina TaxID=2653855 RepID=UPI001260E60D|nr:glycosyltransferase family A protein [Tautonia marina]